MNKKNILVLVVLVLVVAVFGLLEYRAKHINDYSVVYLSTGEVYIGHLTTFPDMQLTGSYILDVTKSATDPTQSTFQLQPIDQALWAPKVLHLNEKNVVFYGPILPTSKIGQALVGK